MAYGSVLTDTVQSSTAGTPPQFNDGNGTQTGTLCRAWVNFNGTGTVAIRGSFNVSSITDNGTGSYTVNFTTAMPDANYNAVGSASQYGSNSQCYVNVFSDTNAVAPTTTSFKCSVINYNASAYVDSSYVTVSVFR
jgi:hypothetical protein